MRNRSRYKQFLCYLFFGALNTIATFVLCLLLSLAFYYQVAYALAYASGILFSYLLNTTLVFKIEMGFKNFTLFPLICLVQYVISAILLALLVESFRLPVLVSPLLVAIGCIPLNFVLTRAFFSLSGVATSRSSKR